MATKRGIIKKTKLREYSRPRQNGINAINIREDDMLLNARLVEVPETVEGEDAVLDNIVIAAKNGKAIRFPHDIVRSIGRTATGVRGIRLENEDEAIGMVVINKDKNVLVVSENGYGKRSSIEDYRITNRGGKGVKTINITEKTGKLIAINAVTDNDHLMIITKHGIMIRIAISNLRIMGRATQGVRLINLKNGDQIAAVTNVVNGATQEEEAEAAAEAAEAIEAAETSVETLDNNEEEENQIEENPADE
jgi:DNA gyrase subunit A